MPSLVGLEDIVNDIDFKGMAESLKKIAKNTIWFPVQFSILKDEIKNKIVSFVSFVSIILFRFAIEN